jgi:hypothetical protein
MILEHEHEIDLCRCGSNPEAIVKAAQAKTKSIEITTKGETRWVEIRRYSRVWFVENLMPSGSRHNGEKVSAEEQNDGRH